MAVSPARSKVFVTGRSPEYNGTLSYATLVYRPELTAVISRR